MILQIERRWNREPGWLRSLPKATQAELIADYRLDIEDPKTKAAKANAAKRARFDKMRQRAINQGSENG